MRYLSTSMAFLALAACGADNAAQRADDAPSVEVQTGEQAPEQTAEQEASQSLRARQLALIDQYFEIYKAKDADALLALYDENIFGVLYPSTVFGKGVEAARTGVEGDFAANPTSRAHMPHRFNIARDKWLTAGEWTDGELVAPLWILFDFNAASDKIEATYTQIGWSGMIDGVTVEEPTAAMQAAIDAVFDHLAGDAFDDAVAYFADDAALYAYPPGDIENYSPVITGASDVASVLAFKWGEGAWKADNYVNRYLQFVLVGIPGEGLDRAALFTFGADPASPSFEKIIRVDVMGPSGG